MINIPSIPDDLMVNEVSVYPAIMGQDADAAYRPTYSTSSSTTVCCSVQPRMVEEVFDDQQRIQRILNYHVFFTCEPNVKPRDHLVWQDQTGAIHTLIVQATRNEGGVGLAWVVRAIERL